MELAVLFGCQYADPAPRRAASQTVSAPRALEFLIMSMKLENPLSIAVGAALFGSIAVAHAADSGAIFQLIDLERGYMVSSLGNTEEGKSTDVSRGADKAMDVQVRGDTDHDGKLSKAEFDATNGETFASFDTNHDGSVTQAEMNVALQARAPKGEEGYCGADKGKGKEGKCGEGKCGEGKCGVGLMDANRDGAMTKAEYIAGHEATFYFVDTNNDGFITPDEDRAADGAD